MGEDVFENAMDLVNLQRYDCETQLGKEIEVLSMHEAWTEGPSFCRVFDSINFR